MPSYTVCLPRRQLDSTLLPQDTVTVIGRYDLRGSYSRIDVGSRLMQI